jgi:hypothetical protein
MTTQVTTDLFANSALTTPKIADGAITTAKIADAGVTAAKLAAGLNAGRWVAGTTLTLDPIAVNTRTTTAHGLGTTPVFAAAFLECKTPELGYTAGQRISLSSSVIAISGVTIVIQVRFDATNTILEITNNTLPSISHATNAPPGVAAGITAGNWIVRVIPYALTT